MLLAIASISIAAKNECIKYIFQFSNEQKELVCKHQWGSNHNKVNIRDGEIQSSVASSAVYLCWSVLYSDLKSTFALFSNSGDNSSSWVIVAT